MSTRAPAETTGAVIVTATAVVAGRSDLCREWRPPSTSARLYSDNLCKRRSFALRMRGRRRRFIARLGVGGLYITTANGQRGHMNEICIGTFALCFPFFLVL